MRYVLNCQYKASRLSPLRVAVALSYSRPKLQHTCVLSKGCFINYKARVQVVQQAGRECFRQPGDRILVEGAPVQLRGVKASRYSSVLYWCLTSCQNVVRSPLYSLTISTKPGVTLMGTRQGNAISFMYFLIIIHTTLYLGVA